MAKEDQSRLARPGGGAAAATDDTSAPPAPSVLAVVVTHDPGPDFEATLASLAAQDYDRLSVLVVDVASAEDLTPRIKAVLPEATIVRRDEDEGFGAAANVVLEDGPRAALYLFCHDDVALQPDAVSRLVEEVLRSNAAVVGPKMVDWDDPSVLRDVGLVVDKFGVSMSAVEEGELDQEQHDALTDVFAVPGGCTMVRADLFRTIGGFDPAITFRGDDVDLCWRAQLAGARVMVVPAAVVRHHGQLNTRRLVDDTRRLRMRHQLRTLLSCTSFMRLVRLLPQAMALSVAEMVLAVIGGRVSHARDVVGAWTWNLRRLPEIHRRRKQISQFRQVSDSEVHQLQVRGSVRLRAFLRGQIGRHESMGGLAASGRNFALALRHAPNRDVLVVLAVLVLVLLVGSRHLLTRAIPAVGELAPLEGGTRALLEDWWRGWHTRALGTSTPAPTALVLFGLAGIPLFGHAALLRTVLTLAPLPLGLIGMWRVMRPFASQRAATVATVAYAANPV
ncbi:MAG TPA: glycosyltransferase family 2 protein, partial [Acidimicrobiales bacterium]